MIRNYFITAYRQLVKNRLFSIVNIIGLSTGFASIMALAILVYQYATTDRNQKGIDQLYYLKTTDTEGRQDRLTTYPLLGEIVKTCPEVKAATHIQSWYYPWLKYESKEFQETTQFVDTGFLAVFMFPLKYGDAATALHNKYSIVLSEDMSRRFFGDVNPIGKIITADDTLSLTVTGVLQQVPSNSTIRPTILLPTALLESNPDFKSGADWYNTFAENYLRIDEKTDTKKLDARIATIVKANYQSNPEKTTVFTVPFTKISQENAGLMKVIIKGAIGAGIFILFIILVNLINLNTAGMYTRSKEVAVKQILGGTRRNIVTQFCIENGLLVLISIVLAWIIFSLLLLPGINTVVKDKVGEIETGLARDFPLILFFTGLGMVVAILAASLPAMKLVTLKVTEAVKGKVLSGQRKGIRVRNIFITAQFVLAITLICATVVLNRQVSFMKSAALGFDKDDVAVVALDLAFRDPATAMARFESIVNDLKANPHVETLSTNNVVPTAFNQNYNDFVDPSTGKVVSLKQANADAGFLPTYKIPIIEGKNFDDALSASQKNAIVINRTTMKAFGWTSAIGKQIKSKGDPQLYTIIGVSEDYNYQDLQKGIEPIIQWYGGKPSLNNNYLSVRTRRGYLKPVMQQLEKDFRTMPSRRNFTYVLMSDKVGQQYTLLDGILKVTNYIAILTIIIASLGMFGLVSLFAKQRVKEIGIRKVLGSSMSDIVSLLSKDFLVLVGLAIFIAIPITLYIMSNWLQDFAYRINIRWWMFGLGGMIALLIAGLTISFQVIRAGRANPVLSLRGD